MVRRFDIRGDFNRRPEQPIIRGSVKAVHWKAGDIVRPCGLPLDLYSEPSGEKGKKRTVVGVLKGKGIVKEARVISFRSFTFIPSVNDPDTGGVFTELLIEGPDGTGWVDARGVKKCSKC